MLPRPLVDLVRPLPLRFPFPLPLRFPSPLAPCLLALVLAACSPSPRGEAERSGERSPAEPPAATAVSSESPPAEELVEQPEERDLPVVVFLGDSLTAGLGLDESQAYPALVAQRLEAHGTPIRAVNAGVSGDTTAGGVRRVDWVLRQEPDVVVVALGGNDALRGLDPADTEANLRRIVERAREAGATVLLAGMLAPLNLGETFTEAFASIYPRLAQEQGVALLPFLLEGVAMEQELNQGDGIHPNAAGQEVIAGNVAQALRPLIPPSPPPSSPPPA